MVALGLRCCEQAFSSCGELGLLSSHGGRASHCSGFSCCRACSFVLRHVESSQTRDRTRVPALAGGFLSIVPLGKSQSLVNSWQRCQVHTMGKEQSLQQTMMGQMDFHKQRMKLDPYFMPFTKIISKCICNLNMRAKTINLLE